MTQTNRLAAILVLVCFFISGVAGLVYEVVWSRYLALSLGHTSYAVVVVLAVFMGGLAIGYGWLGQWADQLAKPLVFYGWLEIALGLYAFAFPAYFSRCQEAYEILAQHSLVRGVALQAIRFCFSALTILLPAILMGATLPVLTRFVIGSLSELRQKVGLLYFVNSAGAVLGCWLADFWWIPMLGLSSTVAAAGALNVAVGLAALSLSVYLGRGREAAIVPSQAAEPEETDRLAEPTLGVRSVMLLMGLSGFVAMLYEVAWTRVLALVLGSSTHMFSFMLITFISGIAAGSLAIACWKGPLRLVKALGWTELAAAVVVLASMLFYERLPFWFTRLSALLARSEEAYGLNLAAQAAIGLTVMFVPTACLGMTLPLAARIACVEQARTGRTVGRVFAANTLGTVLGATLSGFCFLPWLGLARTFALGVIVNAFIGLAILARGGRTWRAASLAVAIPLAIGVWLMGFRLHETWQRAFTLGLWHDANPPKTRGEFQAKLAANRIEFYRDGAGATVSVHSFRQGGTEHLALKINGKADASTAEDVPTQLLLGHLPMLLRPDAQRALVIGLGSGMTCEAVACHPTIQQIDAVEIFPEVVEAARRFARHNGNVLKHPKLRLIIEDAKSFLAATDQSYDLIISEPSNPWMAGVAGVFSREFYETCRNRLRPEGLMVQWTHVYESSDEALGIILATFRSVFPHFSVFRSTPWDLLFVGAAQPVTVDFAALEARMREPTVQADLARIHLTRPATLLVREVISQANARFAVSSAAALHRDLYPTLEYAAQKAFYARRQAENWRFFDEHNDPRPSTWLGAWLKTQKLNRADFQELAQGHFLFGLPSAPLVRSLLLRWQSEFPNASEPLEFSARLSDRGSASQLEVQRLSPLRESLFRYAEKDPALLRLYAGHLLSAYRDQRSVWFVPQSAELQAALQRLLATDSKHRRDYLLQLAELAWDRGDDAACLEFGEKAFDPGDAGPAPITFPLDPAAPRRVLARMIEAHGRSGRVSEAWALCQAAQQAGFIGSPSAHREPVVEMICRKVEAKAVPPSHNLSSGAQ